MGKEVRFVMMESRMLQSAPGPRTGGGKTSEGSILPEQGCLPPVVPLRSCRPGEGLISKRQFDVVIEKDTEGYFVATVPQLRGCHTQAKSLDTLMRRIREAIELCLEVGDLRKLLG